MGQIFLSFFGPFFSFLFFWLSLVLVLFSFSFHGSLILPLIFSFLYLFYSNSSWSDLWWVVWALVRSGLVRSG